MRIGITERGDAALDFSWRDKLDGVDGAILITKNITDGFIKSVTEEHAAGRKLIVHAGCTGWGSTVVEPCVPPYKKQLDSLKKLIQAGFPEEKCVLRVDPVFPTENGLKRVRLVLDKAFDMHILPKMRVRISVFDEYRHVKERWRKAGLTEIYKGFQASDEMFESVREALSKYDIQFHTCAEPFLSGGADTRYSGLFVRSGCISNIDLRLMGLPEQNSGINPQNRNGCTCLNCKKELLGNKSQCAHRCIYCYWQKEWRG